MWWEIVISFIVFTTICVDGDMDMRQHICGIGFITTSCQYMHVNVDMHWRRHGRLYKYMGHDVDVKVDDILDEHGHICKEICTKVITKHTYVVIKNLFNFHNMLQLESCSLT